VGKALRSGACPPGGRCVGTARDIDLMLRKNPAKLLGLDG